MSTSADHKPGEPAKALSDPALSVGRRELLAGTGWAIAALTTAASPAAASAVAVPGSPRPTPAAAGSPAGTGTEAMWTLNATEQAFITAAVDTLIPGDALSPSASGCGVVTFIDRQLAGAWGNGARLYRGGPFLKGKPEHGYQLPLTPREYFGAGIAAANRWISATHGGPLDALSEADRAAALSALEAGKADLGELSAAQFFEALLAITMEGFFADPIYGGNQGKAAWRMIGYPGLPATYAEAIDQYRGRRYRAEPKSIGDFL